MIQNTNNTNKFYSIEPYVEGKYKKYNDNHGYVSKDDQEASLVAQCFSHFSYQYTKRQILIVDIQGILLYCLNICLLLIVCSNLCNL